MPIFKVFGITRWEHRTYYRLRTDAPTSKRPRRLCLISV